MSVRETTAIPWWREPTRAQWMTFSAAWASWVLDGLDFTIFLVLIPYITAEFGVSPLAAAGSVTLTLLVRLLGGFLAGYVADRWGRRLPLMFSLVWFAACDAAIAFAPSFTWVLVFRTLFGFGMGAQWTAGTTLAMENWPERSRGIASGVLQGSFAIGYLVAGWGSGFILTQFPELNYRIIFLVAAAPALLVLLLFIWVPESPEWLKRKARSASIPLASAPRPAAWLTRALVEKIAWASGIMGLGFGVYYALISMYGTFLKTELGLSPAVVGNLIATFNVGMLVGAIGCGYLAHRRGPALAIMLPALAALPFLPLYTGVGAASGLAAATSLLQVPALAVGALFTGALGVGFAGVTPMLLTSLFPAEIRARCVGIVYHVGACFAALAPPLVAALAEATALSLAQSVLVTSVTFEVLLVGIIFATRHRLVPVSEDTAGPSSSVEARPTRATG